MLVHLRSKYVLATGMTLLQELSFFRLRDDFFFHTFGYHWCMLLNFSNKLPICNIFVLLSIKANCINKLEVIPINITLFNLFSLLLFLSSYLLLFGNMIIVHQFACIKDLLSIINVFVKFLKLLVFHLQNVCICCY